MLGLRVLLLRVSSMVYGSHAKAVNRRHRGALCSACVGRAVWCACVAPEPYFPLIARVCSKKNNTEHPRQHVAVVDKAHGGAIDVASLHPTNPLPHDFAGLRRGPALARPRHTGHAFGEIVAWCGANHLPCEPASFSLLCCCTLCVHIYHGIYIVGEADFLLMRCVQSPGTIQVLLANKISVRFQTQKTKPNPRKNGRYGHFRPFLGPNFGKMIILGDRGNRKWPNPTIIGSSQTPYC